MHAASPPPARSKELRSGPSSSQPDRRPGRGGAAGRGREVGGQEGVGQLPGEHRLRQRPGARARRARPWAPAAEPPRRAARCRRPAACPARATGPRRRRRRPRRAAPAAPASRTALVARMVAMPSSRFSCSARRPRCRPPPGCGRAPRAAAGRRPGTSCARRASRGRAGRRLRPHGRLGRAPRRRRRGSRPVAGSAGRSASARLALARSSHRLLLCRTATCAAAECPAQPRGRVDRRRNPGGLDGLGGRRPDAVRPPWTFARPTPRRPSAVEAVTTRRYGGTHRTGSSANSALPGPELTQC